ncbi:IS4 family transposase, partial [Petrocella sp. FN5]|uniref:IS4 family transposase n=1 Tax=Petrocella sp. FN5 TaxID=3032002 RepID=UPI0023DCBD9D
EEAVSKNTYYRFLNTSTYNWKKFLLLLSAKVISMFNRLTRPERVNVLILDDSIVTRNRSKSVELLAKIYDHAFHRYQRGFTMLTLGWSDGYSFIPTGFTMLSSRNEKNRFQETSNEIDKRTNGYKRRKDALLKKPEAAVQLIKEALAAGVSADYVLMDTWFTTEPMIKAILNEGLDVVGMVKKGNAKYCYKGKRYSLKELRNLVKRECGGGIFGSINVTTKDGIPVKVVIVRNRTNKGEWLAVLSTDLSISDEEIIRIYGNRWSIEVFFKSAKSFMKLGSEFQGRSYDMIISHTTIVYCRYILLEWLRREENDTKTFGELFFRYCEDIQDMDYITA